MRRDVRVPADPQDFETTLSRPPVAPLDFGVTASGENLIVQILEPSASETRVPNVGYRVIYVPRSFAPSGVISPAALLAMVDVGDTVAFVPALNDGGRQQLSVAGRSADRGWYLCCAVGQRGMIGRPGGACRTPWGA